MISKLVNAFGGQINITKLDACFTRLRVSVADFEAVNQEQLKELGAIGVVYIDGVVQAIFGKQSDKLREDMQSWLESHPESGLAGELVKAYGGESNITELDACLTRLRISVNQTEAVDQEMLKELGALGVVVLDKNVQAIFGKQSDTLRKEMSEILGK